MMRGQQNFKVVTDVSYVYVVFDVLFVCQIILGRVFTSLPH
jgi:hypothetical protein